MPAQLASKSPLGKRPPSQLEPVDCQLVRRTGNHGRHSNPKAGRPCRRFKTEPTSSPFSIRDRVPPPELTPPPRTHGPVPPSPPERVGPRSPGLLLAPAEQLPDFGRHHGRARLRRYRLTERKAQNVRSL